MILLTKLVDDLFLYPQESNILGLKSGKMHYTTLFYTIKSCCFILKLENTYILSKVVLVLLVSTAY